MIPDIAEQPAALNLLAMFANCRDPSVIRSGLSIVDPETYMGLAIEHGIACQIHHNFVSLDVPASNAGNAFLNRLKEYRVRYTAASTMIDHEVVTMLRKLRNDGIEAIVLKGFALAHQVYAAPALRPRADVDVLIRPADKEALKSIFVAAGYHNPRGWEPRAISNQLSFSKHLSNGLASNFDVHIKISNNKVVENILDHEQLLASADTHSLPGIQLIDKPHAMVHAILHLLNHRAAGDLVKMIWHYDIYLLAESMNTTQQLELLQLVDEKGLAHVAGFTLELTDAYFPSPRLREIVARLKNKRSDDVYNYLLTSTYGAKGLLLALRTAPGLITKLDIVRETAFPPAGEIYAKYGKDTKWPLCFLYFRRIVGGLIKYGRSI